MWGKGAVAGPPPPDAEDPVGGWTWIAGTGGGYVVSCPCPCPGLASPLWSIRGDLGGRVGAVVAMSCFCPWWCS